MSRGARRLRRTVLRAMRGAALAAAAFPALACAHSMGSAAWAPGERRAVLAADLEHDIAVHDTLFVAHCRVQGVVHLDSTLAPSRLSAVDVVFEDGIQATDQEGRFYFTDCRFTGPVELTTGSPRVLRFEHCRFEDDADFHSIDCPQFWVRRSSFEGHANFVGIKIRRREGDPWAANFNMIDAHFGKSADFAGSEMELVQTARIRSNDPIQITWGQFGEPWLKLYVTMLDTLSEHRLEKRSYYSALVSELEFWKRNFMRLESREDAAEAQFAIYRVERSRMLLPSDLQWWLLWLGELPNRFGTRPYRPLRTGVAIIFVFSVLFWRLEPFEPAPKEEKPRPRTPEYWFALLWSLENFVPFLDVTGVRSWGWVVSPRYRWLELSERLLGLLLSALAAYGIGSRLT